MNKIKLLLAAPTFYPFYGGAEMRFRAYLPLLCNHGIKPSVFTGTPKAKKITEEHKKEPWYSVSYGEKLADERYQDIEVERYRLHEKPAKKRLGMYHHKLRQKIEAGSDAIDVIQFLSPYSKTALETFNCAKANNIATVVACTLAKKPDPNFIKRMINKYNIKKIYSSSDCVVVSSEEVKEYLVGFGINNRIEVIGNGVDTQKYKPVENIKEKERLREKLGINKNKKILLNVGSIHPRKGTDLLLRAFEIAVQKEPDLELYIAGSPTNEFDRSLESFRREIGEHTTKSGLIDKVHFLGLINNVDEYMKASDIFIFPSREEGMGNVVMEAMASGLPVVITNYLGFPSVFGKDKKHYLLADFNELSIAEKIETFLCHAAVKTQFIESALQNVRAELHLDRSIKMFADLYKEVAR